MRGLGVELSVEAGKSSKALWLSLLSSQFPIARVKRSEITTLWEMKEMGDINTELRLIQSCSQLPSLVANHNVMSQSTEFKAALSSAGFTGDIVIPGDPDYDAAIVRVGKNAQRKAGLVAFVKSADDVSKVIRLVNSSSGQVPVVIRGGGHSPAGCSSTEGGIVIDLSRYLNAVRVDPGKKLAYAGGGAIWATVDKEAIKHSLATPSGGINTTGVGG